MLEDLKALVAELGAEAVFLSGNHDPGWPGKGWVELADGRVVVTHGDAVMWAGSPWSREALERMEKIRALWDEHRGAGDDASARLALAREMAVALRAKSVAPGRSFWRRVLDAVNPPRRAWEIARVWWGQAGAAERFAERYFPRAEVLVIGHFHRPGLWRRGGRVLINTGAHVAPLGARWVEWRAGELRVGEVVRREDGSFARREGKVVWRQGALG